MHDDSQSAFGTSWICFLSIIILVEYTLSSQLFDPGLALLSLKIICIPLSQLVLIYRRNLLGSLQIILSLHPLYANRQSETS